MSQFTDNAQWNMCFNTCNFLLLPLSTDLINSLMAFFLLKRFTRMQSVLIKKIIRVHAL